MTPSTHPQLQLSTQHVQLQSSTQPFTTTNQLQPSTQHLQLQSLTAILNTNQLQPSTQHIQLQSLTPTLNSNQLQPSTPLTLDFNYLIIIIIQPNLLLKHYLTLALAEMLTLNNSLLNTFPLINLSPSTTSPTQTLNYIFNFTINSTLNFIINSNSQLDDPNITFQQLLPATQRLQL